MEYFRLRVSPSVQGIKKMWGVSGSNLISPVKYLSNQNSERYNFNNRLYDTFTNKCQRVFNFIKTLWLLKYFSIQRYKKCVCVCTYSCVSMYMCIYFSTAYLQLDNKISPGVQTVTSRKIMGSWKYCWDYRCVKPCPDLCCAGD